MTEISRRQALGLAAAAAAAPGFGRSVGGPDIGTTPTGTYHYVQVARRTDGADVAARVTDLEQLYLGWSLSAETDGTPSGTVTFLGPVTPGQFEYDGRDPLASFGMAIFTITSTAPVTIPPNTQVFAQLSYTGSAASGWLGDPIRFTTYPTAADTTPRTFAVLSCQRAWNDDLEPKIAGTRLELIWHDIVTRSVVTDHNPSPIQEIFWDGDLGYWGSGMKPTDPPGEYAQHQWPTFDHMPTLRLAMAQIPWRYHKDDHEVGKDNPDPDNGLYKLNAAIKQMFVDAPEGAVQSPQGYPFLAQRMDLTPHVRIYHLDSYARDRGPSSQRGDRFNVNQPHNPDLSKSFLGGLQDKWLFDDLRYNKPAGLVLFVCPKAFLGDGIPDKPPSKERDKVRAYPGWRDWFVDRCDHNGILGRMAWIGGDRHATGYCPGGTHNPFGGFPVWLSSGVSMHPLTVQPGEDATQNTAGEGYLLSEGWKPAGWGESDGPSVLQYVSFTVTDNPTARQITLAGQSRHIENTWDGTQGPESDEWANWLAAGVQPSIVAGSNVFSY